ncbi:MAG: DUF4038 domain-containing protein [Bacteroidota bacterium]
MPLHRPLFFCLICLFAASFLRGQNFPISVHPSGRYLVDAQGSPFLYQADTPWMIWNRLSVAEADEYMRIRKEQGFNTLQINLAGTRGERNLYGELPFGEEVDLSQPSPAFFAHVDEVIALGKKHNLMLAIVPLWSGCCRQDYAGQTRDGGPAPLNQNGAKNAREYGRWLGRRYGKEPHVMWIMGGDNDPFNALEEITAMAEGLDETNGDQLMTYHAASTHSSTDVLPAAPWLDLSMVYTYFRGFNKAWNRVQPDVYEVSAAEYRKQPAMPFFLGESNYEREHDPWGNERQVRKQAYWALFAGATGHAYGSPNWKIPTDWREFLDLPGANSIRHLPRFMDAVGWPEIAYDWRGKFLGPSAGPYAANNYAMTVFAADYGKALVYAPDGGTLDLDLGMLNANQVTVTRLDPRDGSREEITRLDAFGRQSVTLPKGKDWLLLIE